MSQIMGAKVPGMNKYDMAGLPPGLPGGKGGFAQTGASMMNPGPGSGLAQTGKADGA